MAVQPEHRRRTEAPEDHTNPRCQTHPAHITTRDAKRTYLDLLLPAPLAHNHLPSRIGVRHSNIVRPVYVGDIGAFDISVDATCLLSDLRAF